MPDRQQPTTTSTDARERFDKDGEAYTAPPAKGGGTTADGQAIGAAIGAVLGTGNTPRQ